MFLYEVEAEGLMDGYVHVGAICEMSVVLPAVYECDFLVMSGASTEAVQDFCWEWVSMVCFVKQLL